MKIPNSPGCCIILLGKGASYPMIVHLYEQQSQYLHQYWNPDMYNSDGFNITNFLSQGYAVLLPDISYTFGKLSESVTGSVLAAVDAAVALGGIAKDKVGLIGHSFGGYETNLIITQTDRFATAVAGAAWTDLVSSYLYVGETFARPDYYRAERDQLRIGKSLYEDQKAYLNSSPVLLAHKVHTPLLGWTGEQDRHVHALQSHEFYMALRRLAKPHVLLVYPEEGHNLYKKTNQEDLSGRIEQWFGHYLKDNEKEEWMDPEYY